MNKKIYKSIFSITNFTRQKFIFITGVLFLFLLPLFSFSQTNVAPLASVSQSGGGSGAYGASNYNDGVIAACDAAPWGWVDGGGWIEFTWPTAQGIDEIKFFKANRPMSSCIIEYWNGSGYVNITNYSDGTECEHSVSFPLVSTTKIRLRSIGGSNPNFREIEIYKSSPYSAEIISMNTGISDWCMGDSRDVTLKIKNTGTATWYANGVSTCPAPANNNRVAVSYKWNGDSGFDVYNNRNPLPNDVAPGATVDVTFTVQSPSGSPVGTNNLTFNLIAQECAWFGNAVSNKVSSAINVGTCCSAMPNPGNTIASTNPVCGGTDFTLSLQNSIAGLGVTYQWQSANNSSFTSGVVNLGTGTTQVTDQSASKYYRCLVTCTGTSQSKHSNPVYVTMIAGSSPESYGNNTWNSYAYNSFTTTTSTTPPFFNNFVGKIQNGITNSNWNQLSANWGNGPAIGVCQSTGNDYYTTSHLMTRTGAANQNRWRRFTSSSDDGMRISTNGGTTWNVRNGFGTSTQGNSTSAPVYNAGNPMIRVDQRENSGGSNVSTSVCEMAGKYTFETGKWKAFVFDERNVEFNRYNGYFEESSLNFCNDWGNGQPSMTGQRCGMSMNNDEFSVRYIRQHTFAPGNYIIRVKTDDGARVSINSTPTENWNVFNSFGDSQENLLSGSIFLSGNQYIYFDMREKKGGAYASFNIAKVPDAPTGVVSNLANNAICTTGGAIKLTAQGGEGDVLWYSGSCEGTYVGTGNSITVSPTSNTTYYVLNSNSSEIGGCGGNVLDATSACQSIEVLVGTTPTVDAGSDKTVCTGGSVELEGEEESGIDPVTPAASTCNAPSSTNTNYGIYIKDVVTTGGVSNINNSSTGSNSYTDYSSHIVKVGAGSPFSISVAPGSTTNDKAYSIWIDWSNNGTFEPSEQVATSGNTNSGISGTFNASINAPNNQPIGKYRMRVRTKYISGYYLNLNNACTNFSNFGNDFLGETEDYYVEIENTNTNTYSWSGGPIVSGGNTLTPTVKPTSTTTYTLTVTSNGCSASDDVEVTIEDLEMTGTFNVCSGETTDLSVTGETDWTSLPTGGSISTIGNDRIHKFTESESFITSQASLEARVLVVGGGGGGGNNGGGGGGAGQVVYSTNVSIGTGTTSVIIGGGGAVHNNSTTPNTAATNGASSSAGSITAIGGGGGASRDRGLRGQDGASGGGGGGSESAARRIGGTGTAGFNAGNGFGGGCNSSGGGGGGAGGAGASGANLLGGDGGIGIQNDITGSALWYAGGGGGGITCAGENTGFGGSGVGGRGQSYNVQGTSGQANTGSGGGADGTGGSGVVIVRYTTPKWEVTNGTGSATINVRTGVLTGGNPGTATVTYT